MMRFRHLFILVLLVFVSTLSLELYASSETNASKAIKVDRNTLKLIGKVNGGQIVGKLHLTALRDVSNLRLEVSSLTSIPGDGIKQEMIPASAITINPNVLDNLPSRKLIEVLFNMSSPNRGGNWTGNVNLCWEEKDTIDTLEIDLELIVQNRPAFKAVPAEVLKIYGVRGGKSIERIFLLQETALGVKATGLKHVTQDLIDADNNNVFSAEKIIVNFDKNNSELEGGGFMKIKLNIDLKDIAAGTYKGDLIIMDDYRTSSKKSLEVYIKHPSRLPIIVLIAGILLGMILTRYRTRGKDRDKLFLRIEAVGKRMNKEKENYRKALGKRISGHLKKAKSEVESQKWEDAKTAIKKAEDLMDKWSAESAEWREKIDECTELKKKMESKKDQATVIQIMLKELDDIDWFVFNSAEEMGKKIHPINNYFHTLIQVEDMLNKLSDNIQKANYLSENPKKKEEYLNKVKAQKNAWKNINSMDKTKITNIKDEIDKIQKDLDGLAQQKRDLTQNAFNLKFSKLVKSFDKYFQKLPETIPIQASDESKDSKKPPTKKKNFIKKIFSREPEGARFRLRLFSLFGYFLTLLILFWFGFNELYESNATFGDNATIDYFALFVWGFGSEATRSSVTELLKGLS